MTTGHHNQQYSLTNNASNSRHDLPLLYVVTDEIYINLVISVYPSSYILHPKNTPEPHGFSRLGCPRRV